MPICENCRACVPKLGQTSDGKRVCCAHCVYNPLGCRCGFGELGVAETFGGIDPGANAFDEEDVSHEYEEEDKQMTMVQQHKTNVTVRPGRGDDDGFLSIILEPILMGTKRDSFTQVELCITPEDALKLRDDLSRELHEADRKGSARR